MPSSRSNAAAEESVPLRPPVPFDPQMKNAVVLGFCWTSWNEIVFVTDQGIEFYQVASPVM